MVFVSLGNIVAEIMAVNFRSEVTIINETVTD